MGIWADALLLMLLCVLHKAQLEQEERESSQIEHSISSLQKDMVRLSALITEKRGQQERLEQGNILIENDFIHALKVKDLHNCIM